MRLFLMAVLASSLILPTITFSGTIQLEKKYLRDQYNYKMRLCRNSHNKRLCRSRVKKWYKSQVSLLESDPEYYFYRNGRNSGVVPSTNARMEPDIYYDQNGEIFYRQDDGYVRDNMGNVYFRNGDTIIDESGETHFLH